MTTQWPARTRSWIAAAALLFVVDVPGAGAQAASSDHVFVRGINGENCRELIVGDNESITTDVSTHFAPSCPALRANLPEVPNADAIKKMLTAYITAYSQPDAGKIGPLFHENSPSKGIFNTLPTSAGSCNASPGRVRELRKFVTEMWAGVETMTIGSSSPNPRLPTSAVLRTIRPVVRAEITRAPGSSTASSVQFLGTGAIVVFDQIVICQREMKPFSTWTWLIVPWSDGEWRIFLAHFKTTQPSVTP